MGALTLLKADDDGVKEYQSLLDQLDDEAENIKKQDATNDKRLKAIKEQIGGIMDNLGGKDIRVAVVVESGRAWDRRISMIGAGMSLELLETVLGADAYRKLCTKMVSYEFDPMKLENARAKGVVTDAHVKEATVLGTPRPSYYRPKLKDIEDDEQG